jgi:iron complex outermembrane receptor protein
MKAPECRPAAVTPRVCSGRNGARPLLRRLGVWLSAGVLAGGLAAAEPARRNFNLPADLAANSLKAFAQQSGIEVVIRAELGRTVRTQPVRGEYTPREALERLLARTGLAVKEDAETGVMAIVPAALPAPARSGAADAPEPGRSAQGPAPRKPPEETEAAVKLSPFVVEETSDVGYLATSTLAGSRLNTPLRDVAAQISVFTPEFLRDMAFTNLEEAYLYSTNVEGYLEYTPGGDQGSNFGALLLRNNHRIRGLGAATNLRNFFPTGFDADTYNTERITIASGPNAILFGLGNPGGITDASLKNARFRHTAEIGARFDTFGSHRYSLDANRVLWKDRIALRLAGLDNNNRTFREPSRDENRRFFATMTFQPFRHTTLHWHSEWIRRDASRAPMILQRDYVTPWLDAGRPEFNNAGITTSTAAATVNSRIPAALANVYQRTGVVHVYAHGNTPGTPAAFTNWANTVVTSGVHLGAPAAQDRAYDWSLNRPTLYDPIHNPYGGTLENRHRGGVQNLTLQQQLRDNLHLEIGWMREQFRERWGSFADSAAMRVYADANRYLPDGATPNPNFGKLYSQIGTVGNRTFENREDTRVTLAYEPDFTRRSGWLRWLGRYRLGALYDYYNFNNRTQASRLAMAGKPSFLSAAAQNSLGDTSRLLTTRYYFGDGHNSPVAPFPGGPLDFAEPVPLTGPTGERVSFNMWDGDGSWSSPTGTKQNVISRVLNAQGYLLGDRLVGFVGWREDRIRLINAFDEFSTTRKAFLQNNGSFAATGLFPRLEEAMFPDEWQTFDRGNSLNWGLVAHPLRWLSLRYSNSENFAIQPNTWFDPYGRPLPGAFGNGEDYGVSVALPDNKLSLRINRFVNRQFNTRPDNIVSALRTVPFQIEQRVNQVAPSTPPQGIDVVRYAIANYQTTNTYEARGYDIELVANPARGWRGSLSIGHQRSVTTVDDTWWRWVDERLPVWQTFGRGWNTETLTESGTQSIRQTYENWVATQRDPLLAANGRYVDNQRQWRVNALLSHEFFAGRWRGLALGGGGRWRSAATTGYQLKTLASGQQVLDLDRPYEGPEEFYIDAFARYSFRSPEWLWAKARWRVQVNVRNLLDEDGFLATQAAVDGRTKVYTYQFPRQFIVAAEAEF